jgi:formylglycine-generating enzyme required for sulfatase activity
MTDETPTYNLAAVRDLLLAAFTADDLRRLFLYTESAALKRVADEFGPNDGLAALVEKAIAACRKRALLPALLAEVEGLNPAQYARFAHQLAAGPPTLDSPESMAARNRYLAALSARYNVIETHAFTALAQDEGVGSPRRLPLLAAGDRPGVYVPLSFDARTAQRDLLEMAGGKAKARRTTDERELAEQEMRPLELVGVLELPGHLALVGDAGCGKTTVLHVVVSALAAEDPAAVAPDLALALPEPRPLPVFLPLRLFERACGRDEGQLGDGHPNAYRRCAADLLRFVDDWFAQWCPAAELPPGFLATHLRAGRAWLLLDALDEVPDPAHRETVRNVIQELAGQLPGTRLIVTARVAAYHTTRLDERFTVLHVRDLDEAQRTQMVHAIYAGLALPDAGRRAADLDGRFQSSEALRDLARTPVMVWTAAVIHALRGELPEGRAALYEAYVDILLKQSFKRTRYDTAAVDELADGGEWPLADRREYLTYAAFGVHRLLEDRPARRGERVVVVGEDELADELLAPYLQEHTGLTLRDARRRARDFLALMVERSGLLYETEGGYTLGDHLTMQEFLAGRYLADHYRWDDAEGYAALFRDKVGHTWWREVFLLAAGYLAEARSSEAKRFLELIGAQGEAPADRLAALALAARGLLQLRARLRRPPWYTALAQTLANRLYQALYTNPADAPPADRQEAGLALGLLYGYPGEGGALADPRFAHPGGLPDFVPIEAGWFWMGDGWGTEHERPRHRVYLDAYELARFPTTNAMYARFLEAGGYEDGRWWATAIADDRWAGGQIRDSLSERTQPVYWDDPRFNNPCQPVVGITWYEAAAYCVWLSATQEDGAAAGRVYRLPTEAEWERAARGPSAADEESESGQGWKHPWGDKWREDHCNSEEAGLGTTSAVGIFSKGAAQDGLEDMVGNVYKWCQDWYAEDCYARSREARNPAGPDAGDYRIIRGGSWGSNGPKYCRCGCRRGLIPGDGGNYWGFRCARASSSVP